MKTWVRRSLNVGALTAGALLASGAAAQANPAMTSTDNTGAANGTQLRLPIQAPINACGNAVGVAGAASAFCEGGSAASLDREWSYDYYAGGGDSAGGGSADLLTNGNTGIGNGTQAYAPVQAPINVCGNAVAVLGTASASCTGGASADQDQPDQDQPDQDQPDQDQEDPGYGGGYEDPGYGYEEATPAAEASASASNDGAAMHSSGNVGLLNGTQLQVPVQVPINICGNAIGVLGVANAGCGS